MRGILIDPKIKGGKWILVLIAYPEDRRKIGERGGVDQFVMKHTPGSAEPWALGCYKKAEVRLGKRLFIALRGYRYEMDQVIESILRADYELKMTKKSAFFSTLAPQSSLETILGL